MLVDGVALGEGPGADRDLHVERVGVHLLGELRQRLEGHHGVLYQTKRKDEIGLKHKTMGSYCVKQVSTRLHTLINRSSSWKDEIWYQQTM